MRVGVVGTGVAGTSHLFDIVTDERLELTAVCAAHEDRARTAADWFGAGSHFTALDQMLASTPLDAVVIAAPPAVTPGLLARCLTADVAVLVDKPAGSAAEHLAPLAVPDPDGARPVRVAYNRRYASHVQRARDIVAAHPGTILKVECRWSAPFLTRYASGDTYRSTCGFGDGVLLDTATHVFDTLAFLGVGSLEVRHSRLRRGTSTANGADVEAHLTLAGDRARVEISIEDGGADDQWCLRLWAPWGSLSLCEGTLTGSADGHPVDVLGQDIHRPVSDLYCPAQDRRGATLPDAIAALRLVDEARAGARLQRDWIRPRAKALGRLNGAC